MSERITTAWAKRAVGAALVAAVFWLAAPAEGRFEQSAAEPRVTILARQTVIGMGQRLTLYGGIAVNRANEVVTLQVKECGATWFRGIAAARTDADGSWTIDNLNPGITAAIRAVWNGNESAAVTVRQRAWVTVRLMPGSRSRYEVSAWRHQGKRVQVQRFDGRLGTWRTFRTVVIGADGAVQFTASLRRGTRIRAVVPLTQALPCYVAGTSAVVRV